MPYVFEIPESRLQRLSVRVAKAAQRAPKSGLPVPSFRVTGRRSQEFTVHDALARLRGSDTDTRSVFVDTVTVELDGFAPTVGEWKVVGSRGVARALDGRPFVSNCGHVPSALLGSSLSCDHCGYNRKRLETFIVCNETTGETAQVGSTCADAFLGNGVGVAEGLSEIWSVLRDFEAAAREDLMSSGFLGEEVRTVLALAHRRVQDDGFVSSATARAAECDATWSLVCEDLAACRRPGAREEDFPVLATDFFAADDIIESYRHGAQPEGFAYSVRTAIERGVAGLKDVAILTAAAHIHVQELRRAQEREAVAASSEHTGNPGERIEFVGKVRRIFSFQGRYGERCYVTMFDADGNLMLWKTGGGHGLEEGMAYEMKGTVKAHGTCEKGPFEGAPQTEMSRVAVLACLGPASFATKAQAQLAPEDEEALDLLFPGMQ